MRRVLVVLVKLTLRNNLQNLEKKGVCLVQVLKSGKKSSK